MPAVVVLLFLAGAASAAEVPIKALRVWPSQDYTRMTFESPSPITYQVSVIGEPGRVVLDLQNVEYDSLQSLMAPKSFDQDPYVKGVRIGRYKAGVTRLVVDLRAEVRPQVFALAPIAPYQHRLVLDLYPLTPPDPLADLIKREQGQTAPVAAPQARVVSPQVPVAPPQAAVASPQASVAQQIAIGKTLASLPSEPVQLDPLADLIKRAQMQAAPGGSAPQPSAAQAPALAGPGSGGAPAAVAADPRRSTELDLSGSRSELAKAGRLPRTVTIVVDAGHGGEDPGARGHRGTYEKDVTLAIAGKLKTLIDEQPQMRAVLTRDSDYFIPLAGRVDKAHRARADLFVSIHADSFVRANARGSSVFALSERGATSAAASWLASQENKADLIGGANADIRDRHVVRTLLDLSQTAAISDSLTLGGQVLSELGGVNMLHKNYVEQAGFAVLKSPDVPSILVETAFISNPEEESRLKDAAYQGRVARAILTGIKRYLARNPPLSRQNIAAGDTPRR